MKSDMERNEWADEEMSLKRFGKSNPFTVPSGYFEEAGKRILSEIRLDELKSSGAAQGFAMPEGYFDKLSAAIQSRINIDTDTAHPGFAVPKGYFEQLTGNIQSRINIDSDSEKQGFTLPNGYFEQLAGNIQSRINIDAALNSDAESFTVPEKYFENLEQQITARIAVEELLESHTPTFSVPENYFEKLNQDILNKTVDQKPAVNQKPVLRKTIVRKLWASNTFKYATAACLALIVGAGAFLKEAQAPVAHDHSFLHTQLSEIPAEEIKNYLQLNIDVNDTRRLTEETKQINTDALNEDLQDYIDVN